MPTFIYPLMSGTVTNLAGTGTDGSIYMQPDDLGFTAASWEAAFLLWLNHYEKLHHLRPELRPKMFIISFYSGCLVHRFVILFFIYFLWFHSVTDTARHQLLNIVDHLSLRSWGRPRTELKDREVVVLVWCEVTRTLWLACVCSAPHCEALWALTHM